MLSEPEKQQAVASVRDLIVGSGLVARHFRVVGPGLYGLDDQETELLGDLAAELVETPAVDLANNVDASVCVLPDADVLPADRLRIGNKSYRIQAIQSHRLFGVVTHRQLSLIQLR